MEQLSGGIIYLLIIAAVIFWLVYRGKKTASTGQLQSDNPMTGDKDDGTYQFKTLLGYGKFLSAIGWGLAAFGILGLIGGLNTGRVEGIMLASASFLGTIFGISMVVGGQLVSCFVSIERNTRMTYETVKQNLHQSEKK